ncbi:hypothetical protein AQF52_0152 [Streptomyces venezuelae]|nr:hypothetical protein [Streptomyces gardneri]ALO05754.1 hypothetical protein AQF52_0152 [Streptomyces venezuelae]WRK34541.1 hypothetical protein U0M97_00745 [Streptomyces venezuelae]CUM44051.1 hypothetical protein BN2537_17067 [Streptomyces venezuelae]
MIFGPFRFRPGTDGADQLGRRLVPFALDLHDKRQIGLDPSMKPS